jgi:hypothetical protein
MPYTLNHSHIKPGMVIELLNHSGDSFYVTRVEFGNDDCTYVYGNLEGFHDRGPYACAQVFHFYGNDRVQVISEP